MQAEATEVFDEVIENGPFPIRFPARGRLDQDEEFCEVQVDGEWRRIRFHDYDEVYQIPGLYETIFYRTLRCNSPTQMVNLLQAAMIEHGQAPEELSVLDLGAGNGMVGEALQNLGIRDIIGIDIIEEAAEAAARDRPWVYNDYIVGDMTKLPDDVMIELEASERSLLACVASLGYGDIPVQAFATAFNLIAEGGWIVFNIKADFLRAGDSSGFAGLLHRLTNQGVIQMEMYKRYCHRLNVHGQPLYYIGVVATKLGDIRPEFMEA